MSETANTPVANAVHVVNATVTVNAVPSQANVEAANAVHLTTNANPFIPPVANVVSVANVANVVAPIQVVSPSATSTVKTVVVEPIQHAVPQSNRPELRHEHKGGWAPPVTWTPPVKK